MAEADAVPGTIEVSVAYSPRPRQVRDWALQLPQGATVSEALAVCGLFDEFPSLRGQVLPLAVWGRTASPGQALRAQDRVEVLRPLQVDPKVARRERFARQGSRAAGLFARKSGSAGSPRRRS